MPPTISLERPDSLAARTLITELTAELEPLYPPENRHGYSVQKLLDEGVAFFVIREGETPMGCGGVQMVGDEYAEVKRMYVRPEFRGLGLAKMMLDHLADFARSQGARCLRLETGIHQPAAIRLYEQNGFRSIPAFGNYPVSPMHKYFEKQLDERCPEAK